MMMNVQERISWNYDCPWHENSLAFNGASSSALLKGLSQRFQHSYRQPGKVTDDLIFGNPLELRALNYVAHSLWAYSLFEALSAVLRFDHKTMELLEPAYLVTLIDHDQVRGVPADWGERRKEIVWKRESACEGPSVREIVARQAAHLSPRLNSIGVLEPEIFASTKRVSPFNYFFEYHSHHIIWGCSIDRVERWAAPLRDNLIKGLTGAPPIRIDPIKPFDLPRVISYLSKIPFRQRQVYYDVDENKRKTFRAPLQSINVVRCVRDLAGLSLPELTIATGAGKAVFMRAQDRDVLWAGIEALFDL